MRIIDWSSDVCSSDLQSDRAGRACPLQPVAPRHDQGRRNRGRMTDQLSPTRPETGKPAPRAEEVRPAKAAPKPDPIPAVLTEPAPSAEADARAYWPPRLLMVGVPLDRKRAGEGSRGR